MSVLKPRNRLVNFRLTEEEFRSLTAACSVNGARSISDFARSAVLKSVCGDTPAPDPAGDRLMELHRKVSGLESALQLLLRMLERRVRHAPPRRSERS